MDVKFNSLFSLDKTVDLNSSYHLDNVDNKLNKINTNYDINNSDNINLDPRIREKPLILNYDKNELIYQELLDKRQYGSLPVTLISGRPCDTSSCNYDKQLCDSAGWTNVLKDVPISCDNDFMPQGVNGNPNRYINNIDVESRLLNIDYNNQKCGKKNFKNTDSKALKCFNDNLLKNDSLNITNSTTYKHNPKNNRQCKTVSQPIFNQSSKRITNLDW